MNIYSIEVEKAIDEHEQVKDIAVIGVPDSTRLSIGSWTAPVENLTRMSVRSRTLS